MDIDRLFGLACYYCGTVGGQSLGSHPDFPTLIFRCTKCGAVQSEYVTKEFLGNFYASEYRAVRQEDIDDQYIRFMRQRAEAQYQFIIDNFPELHDVPNPRVLDIGAGAGELLLRFHNAQLFATEADEKFLDHLQRLPNVTVFDEGKLAADDLKKQFEIIVLSHVLEHLPDPLAELAQLAELVAPSGAIFLEVPNEPPEVLHGRSLKKRGSAHLHFFTADRLCQLVECDGMFEVRSLSYAGPTISNLLKKETIDEFGTFNDARRAWIRVLLRPTGITRADRTALNMDANFLERRLTQTLLQLAASRSHDRRQSISLEQVEDRAQHAEEEVLALRAELERASRLADEREIELRQDEARFSLFLARLDEIEKDAQLEVSRLRSQVSELQKQLSAAKQETQTIRNTRSYRIGHAILVPAAFVRRVVRRIRRRAKRLPSPTAWETKESTSPFPESEIAFAPTLGGQTEKEERERNRLVEQFARSGELQRLELWRGRFSGQRCFIIGNGPSIRKQDLTLLRDEYTFVSNWFVHHENYEQIAPTFYCITSHEVFGGWGNPRPVLNSDLRELLQSRAAATTKFFSFRFKAHIEEENLFPESDVYYLLFDRPKRQIDEVGDINLDLSKPLDDGYTVILTAALPLARFMGFTEIYLLGCDSEYGIRSPEDDKQYFYDSQLHTTSTSKFSSLQRIWATHGPVFASYEIARRKLESEGIRIVNLTDGGRLEVFPRADYRQVLGPQSGLEM